MACFLQQAGLPTDIFWPGAFMPNISARRDWSANFKVGTFADKKSKTDFQNILLTLDFSVLIGPCVF